MGILFWGARGKRDWLVKNSLVLSDYFRLLEWKKFKHIIQPFIIQSRILYVNLKKSSNLDIKSLKALINAHFNWKIAGYLFLGFFPAE